MKTIKITPTVKVCFLSHSSSTGGAEKSLLELLDTLQAFGVECCVLLPNNGPLVQLVKNRRIPCYIVPYKWWMGKHTPVWKRTARTVWNIIAAVLVTIKLKQCKCDVVYTNTVTICVGGIAAKILRRPHVWHIREFGFEDHGLTFDFGFKFSTWLMNRLSTVCIANSHAVANKYRQYIVPSKVRVIYQPVTTAPTGSARGVCSLRKGNVITCAIIGALQEGKGQEDAIRAVAELLRIGIEAELLIVGDGDPKYRQYLHHLVSTSSLGDRVKFIGHVENAFPFMQMADVVLVCSRCEAFGRVTVEAMKAGKPVIGTRSGGTAELIQEGFNGLLYTPGDYTELAEKIKYLYEHPEIAQRMGENGKRFANEMFTSSRFGEEMLKLLKEVCADRKRS